MLGATIGVREEGARMDENELSEWKTL